MNIADIQAQIEHERAWREEEIQQLQLKLLNGASEEEANKYRRSIVVMMYAHLEGFFRFSLQLYVQAINGEKLQRRELNFAICALSMNEIFGDLFSHRRPKHLTRAEAAEPAFKRFAKEREFLERLPGFESEIAYIDDAVVDLEDNLRPDVLRRLLFRLDFDPSTVDAIQGDLNQLLNHRNSIAHGRARSGINAKTFERLSRVVFDLMNKLTDFISHAATNNSFRRN